MYPNLFKGLGLKEEDLVKYDTLLVRFEQSGDSGWADFTSGEYGREGGDGQFHCG